MGVGNKQKGYVLDKKNKKKQKQKGYVPPFGVTHVWMRSKKQFSFSLIPLGSLYHGS